LHAVILNRYGIGLCFIHIDNSSSELQTCERKYLTITPKTRTSGLGATMIAALEKGPSQQSRLGTGFDGGTTTQNH
jgi:hypothetical protein